MADQEKRNMIVSLPCLATKQFMMSFKNFNYCNTSPKIPSRLQSSPSIHNEMIKMPSTITYLEKYAKNQKKRKYKQIQKNNKRTKIQEKWFFSFFLFCFPKIVIDGIFVIFYANGRYCNSDVSLGDIANNFKSKRTSQIVVFDVFIALHNFDNINCEWLWNFIALHLINCDTIKGLIWILYNSGALIQMIKLFEFCILVHCQENIRNKRGVQLFTCKWLHFFFFEGSCFLFPMVLPSRESSLVCTNAGNHSLLLLVLYCCWFYLLAKSFLCSLLSIYVWV